MADNDTNDETIETQPDEAGAADVTDEPTADGGADAPADAPAEEAEAKPKRSRKKAEPVAEEAPAEEAPAEEAPAEEPAAEEATEAPEAEAEAPAKAAKPKAKAKAAPKAEAEAAPKPRRAARPKVAKKPAVKKERGVYRREPRPVSDQGRRKERRGVVVSSAGEKSITVRVDTAWPHPKYKKIVRRSSRLHAHDEQNAANVGDVVRIVETRPLSKTKRWRLVEILEVAK